jgi:acyl-CoA synthetase (AMP-forming)/AMP-acid ligase II
MEPDHRRIAYESLTLGGLVQRHARYRGDDVAVVAPDGAAEARLTWRAFDARVDRTAHALARHGVHRGDRVATLLGNSLDLVALFWACARMGAAFVPLSPLLNAPGMASLLADARPRVVVGPGARRDLLENVARDLGDAAPGLLFCDVSASQPVPGEGDLAALRGDAPASAYVPDAHADDLMTIMYTSGTTGLPKGIQHTHFIRAMYATTMANAWRMTRESIVLHTGSLVFNGAMVTLLPAFMLGATYIVHRTFDAAAFVETVARERVTHTMLVPSQIVAILDLPELDAARLASLEMVVSLGAPLHREHRERLERAIPGRFYELYGLTEGLVTILDRADAARKRGSVGVPPPFYDLRIVDDADRELPAGEVGEIIGRAPITMPAYLGRDSETQAALRGGWLHSGDLGYVDADGFLFLVDRKKDMIDSGGVKVYPRDIEEIAARHPDVHEVAVFGIPDAKWGETPLAAVVLRKGTTATADALRDFVNRNVAAQYQRVARVVIYDDFPRNAAGKILKREMRAAFWEGRDVKV